MPLDVHQHVQGVRGFREFAKCLEGLGLAPPCLCEDDLAMKRPDVLQFFSSPYRLFQFRYCSIEVVHLAEKQPVLQKCVDRVSRRYLRRYDDFQRLSPTEL